MPQVINNKHNAFDAVPDASLKKHHSLQDLYRSLPAMDSLLLLASEHGIVQQYGKTWVKKQLTLLLLSARQYIAKHKILPLWSQSSIGIIDKLNVLLIQKAHHSLQPVLNLSGTILHTNLGRAQMSEAAIKAVTDVMRHPVPLEFEVLQGKRGHRDDAISDMMYDITGAEACCVVNNNAAAVLLMLACVSAGKEVIVSRGELVEIGGAFRIPDIMAQAGCKLVEVGCTNRTHLEDYRAAITENTAAIMKVHTSNYYIEGYTASVDEAQLANLCRGHNLVMLSDLGSGALVDLSPFGLSKEPMPQEMLNDGVNLVSFSGDKLLGGPQAGIIIGDKNLIAKLQSHPLKRALRCDKMTLAALEATLIAYRQPENIHHALPTFKKLLCSIEELKAQGQELLPSCNGYKNHFSVSLVDYQTQVGSGSQPHIRLNSLALCFKAINHQITIDKLNALFKSSGHNFECKSIIGRLQNGALYLDLRGVDDYRELQKVLILKAIKLCEFIS